MSEQAAADPTSIRKGVVKRGWQLVVTGALFAALLFVPAGRLDWWQAWAFLGVFLVAVVGNATFLLRRDPGLVAERAEAGEGNQKRWDKLLTNALTVLTIVMFLTAGLDKRFAWTEIPAPICVVGLAFILVGNVLVAWSMSANRFFSRVVRIQEDRGHEVCDSGPYHFVRHPGYVGMIVYTPAMAIGLGSWAAAIFAALVVAVFVVRTALEDRTLRAELPGYADYAARVRYRLVPGLW